MEREGRRSILSGCRVQILQLLCLMVEWKIIRIDRLCMAVGGDSVKGECVKEEGVIGRKL